MSIRLMSSAPITVGNHYAAKAEQYCSGFINIFPMKLDGTPASTWVLTFGRAASWTVADGDATVTKVFEHASDDVSVVKTALRTLTLNDLSAPERTRLQGVYDALLVPSSDFTLSTSLWFVVRRMIAWLHAKDEGFASGVMF